MTFKTRSQLRKLFVGGVAAFALTLSANVFASASVSAHSGNMANPPVVASQCDHPGFAHFGFATKQACLSYVAAHGHGHGGGYGGNGGHNDNHPSIFVSIQNAVGGVVNVTINFVSNIFS